MNISERLEQISLFIDKNDKVIDIGCDHALLDVYLVKNKLCKKVLASDISKKALDNGIINIKKHDLYAKIPTIVSDGLNNIDVTDYNTVVIGGMGANTIKKICQNKKKLANIKKIIIQSNNDYPLIRKYFNKIGYFLKDETIVKDGNHYYSVMCFTKIYRINRPKVIKYGILKIANINYYQHVIRKNQKIIGDIKKISLKKWRLKRMNRYYQKYLKRVIGKKLV